VLGQHEGDTEALDYVDEDQQSAGQHRRHDDRHGHGPEGAPARGAEILPGLLDRDVDRLERRQGGKDDEGKERHVEDNGHSGHAVDRGEGDADVAQEARDDSGTAEQQHERIRRDEGREHKRQGGQRQEQRFARDWQAGEAEGQRHAQRDGQQCGLNAEDQAVGQAAEIETARQHAGIVRKRKVRAGAVEEARAEDVEQRVEQEQGEEAQGQDRDSQRERVAAGDGDHRRNTVMRRGSYAAAIRPRAFNSSGSTSRLATRSMAPFPIWSSMRVMAPRNSIGPRPASNTLQPGGGVSPVSSRRMVSGLSEKLTVSLSLASPTARNSCWPTRMRSASPSRPARVPLSRLVVPMNSATNGVAGVR